MECLPSVCEAVGLILQQPHTHTRNTLKQQTKKRLIARCNKHTTKIQALWDIKVEAGGSAF